LPFHSKCHQFDLCLFWGTYEFSFKFVECQTTIQTTEQWRNFILAGGLAEQRRANGEELLNKLTFGLQELQRIIEHRNKDAIPPKQKELI
jgi:hypothetical protein